MKKKWLIFVLLVLILQVVLLSCFVYDWVQDNVEVNMRIKNIQTRELVNERPVIHNLYKPTILSKAEVEVVRETIWSTEFELENWDRQQALDRANLLLQTRR